MASTAISPELRDTLLDQRVMEKTAEFMVSEAINKQGPRYQELVDQGKLRADILEPLHECFTNYSIDSALGNAQLIFKYSESPIELMFLNSINMWFCKNGPGLLRITQPPDGDAIKTIEEHRASVLLAIRHFNRFQSKYKDFGVTMREALISDGSPEEEANAAVNTGLMHYLLGDGDGIMLTLQPKFTSINARTDALCWSLFNKSLQPSGRMRWIRRSFQQGTLLVRSCA